MPEIHSVDYMLLAIVALSAIVGAFRGLVKEALSLAVWIAALWCAARFVPRAAELLGKHVSDVVLRLWLGRLLLLFAVLLAGSLLTWLVGYLIRNSAVTVPDRLFGLFFGVARGVIIVAVLVLALQLAGFAAEPWWRESKLIPYATAVGDALRAAAEQQFGVRVGFRGGNPRSPASGSGV
jgi:membrane protein required for colicin V production